MGGGGGKNQDLKNQKIAQKHYAVAGFLCYAVLVKYYRMQVFREASCLSPCVHKVSNCYKHTECQILIK